MARWALILALVVGNGTWCAAQDKSDADERDWVATLLDPKSSPRAAYPIFNKIAEAGKRGRTNAIVGQLAEHANDNNDAVANQARWAIWCILGPDGYHRFFEKAKLRVLRLQDELITKAPRIELDRIDFGADWKRSELQRFESELAALLDGRRLSLSEKDAGEARKWAKIEELSNAWNPKWGDLHYSWEGVLPHRDEGDVVISRLRWHNKDARAWAKDQMKSWSHFEHQIFANRMLDLILHGETSLIDEMSCVSIQSTEISSKIVPILRGGKREARQTALKVTAAVGWSGQDMEAALWSIVRSLDATQSHEAAEILNNEEARRVARVAELLADLRAMSKQQRIIAAKQLDELAIYPKPITTALVKAAEEGNLVVREGILAALEEAFLSNRQVNITLNELAQRRDLQGIYARAALAAVRE